MSRHLRYSVLSLVLILGTSVFLPAQRLSGDIAAETDSSLGPLVLREIVTGLDHPWAVAPLGDGKFLITERQGVLWYIDTNGTSRIARVDGTPEVYTAGQGGLLDVVAGPSFAEDSYIYLTYSKRVRNGAVTAAGRGRLTHRGEEMVLTGWEEVFTLNRAVSGGRHFGSRIAFGDDGAIYISVGERGEREMAQDPSNHQGSVVRLHPDGREPADNPRIGSGQSARGLFTWGHRNIQGMARHPETGAIWAHEHGPRGGDEINILRGGGNYGWPLVTHGVEYSGRPITDDTTRAGFVDPLLHWTPSIAPSGLAFVQDGPFLPWDGDILVGALAGTHLRRVGLDDALRPVEEEALFEGFARFRDVRSAPDGEIYVLTDESPDGGLYRLERR